MKTSLMRRLAAMGAALAMVSLVSAATMPSASAFGSLVGAGFASFPTYPCNLGCMGSANLVAALDSTTDGHRDGNLSASYDYWESCDLVSGFATGTISGAGLSANFYWDWIGLVGLGQLQSVTLNGAPEPDGTLAVVLAPLPLPPLPQDDGCYSSIRVPGSAVLAAVAVGGTL